MSQIARLYTFTPNTTIEAAQANAELDQLVNSHNNQDTSLTSLLTGTLTVSGVKTFSNGIKTDLISEIVSGNGVAIDGVTLKDGFIVSVAHTGNPSGLSDGVLFYDSTTNVYKGRVNGSLAEFYNSTYKLVNTRGAITTLQDTDQILLASASDADADRKMTVANFRTGLGLSQDLEFLNKQTATNSSQLVFDITSLANVDIAHFEFDGILAQTNASNLRVQVSTDGGATYVSSGYEWVTNFFTTASPAAYNGTSASFIALGGETASYQCGNTAADHRIDGSLKLYGARNNARRTRLGGLLLYDATGVRNAGVQVGGLYDADTVVTHVRFYMDASGAVNIGSGSISLFKQVTT